MALAPTLYDFQISLSQVDRDVQAELSIKVARHPSETMERLWLRVLAYCWKYEERLTFGPGLSEADSPDLLATDYTGVVTQWIRVGKADPLKVQRAVDQNQRAKVTVLLESQERLDSFHAEAADAPRVARAEIAAVDAAFLRQLGAIDQRRIKVSVTFVGDHFYVDAGKPIDAPLLRG